MSRRAIRRRPFIRLLNGVVAFALTFYGVPLPIPSNAPKPLQIAKELFSPQVAEALQVKKVYTGETAFGTADESLTVCISTGATGQCTPGSPTIADTSKAFILVNNSTNSGASSVASDFLISADFFDGSNVYLYRQGSGSVATVEWSVVEFFSNTSPQDVLVQRGTTSIGMTVWPRDSISFVTCEPIKPSAPVMSMFAIV